MNLRYSSSGYLIIFPDDDCHAIVDAMLTSGYNEEFCVALDFSPDFIARLMEAGFLVMSANAGGQGEDSAYILLPKLHLSRSVLFFENLHIKKSIRRYLYKYELRPDADFDRIIDRCTEVHGADWLTTPLLVSIKQIREKSKFPSGRIIPTNNALPVSFALYRDEKLVAGEFGVVCGKVYTSYSGYYDEDNAGTVQIILTARYLREQSFSFFDFGMPLDYKTDLGALDISPDEYVRLFRK
jgi:Leu/Phe-tRNA-protein transferase